MRIFVDQKYQDRESKDSIIEEIMISITVAINTVDDSAPTATATTTTAAVVATSSHGLLFHQSINNYYVVFHNFLLS